MRKPLCAVVVLGSLLIFSAGVVLADVFQPMVLVYVGHMPGYAEALAQIIAETGTRAVAVHSEATLRSLINLPQTRCVVVTGSTPPDFAFLKEFAPVLEEYFNEGGSLIGIGPVCSLTLAEPLATTIFPIRGNATRRGSDVAGEYGSVYVLDEPLGEISGGLPPSFVLTQSQYVYSFGRSGILDPKSDMGEAHVVYRDGSNGVPLLLVLEREGGGRSVSFPGLFIAGVERLPYYWGRLVEEEEFREVLSRSVSWAMKGSKRFDDLGASVRDRLKAEAESISAVRREGEQARAKARRDRILILGVMWGGAIIFQGFLVIRFVVPRMHGESRP